MARQTVENRGWSDLPGPPIGIDFGPTHSCISYLTPEGKAVTLPNHGGELTTPSVVFLSLGEAIVGTEAIHRAKADPSRLIRNPRQYLGSPNKRWTIDGQRYGPLDVSASILRNFLVEAQQHFGLRIDRASIAIPSTFSSIEQSALVAAGVKAGLTFVDLVDEHAAASLAYLLGEGVWFAELAKDQTIMVFDLKITNLEVSLVRFGHSRATVVARAGDMQFGEEGWNTALVNHAIAAIRKHASVEVQRDPEMSRDLTAEASRVRQLLQSAPTAKMVVKLEGRIFTVEINRSDLESLTNPLVDHAEQVVRAMMKANRIGWAKIDSLVVLGGAQITSLRNMLKRICGTCAFATLAPGESIAHGANYFAAIQQKGYQSSSSDAAAQAPLIKEEVPPIVVAPLIEQELPPVAKSPPQESEPLLSVDTFSANLCDPASAHLVSSSILAPVFISYASQDRERVSRSIISLLDKETIPYWFAARDIDAGEDWHDSIDLGMSKCGYVLVAASSKSVLSIWVKAEVRKAIDLFGLRRVIPVVLTDCDYSKIDMRLPLNQHIDLKMDAASSREKLVKLCRTLGVRPRPV